MSPMMAAGFLMAYYLLMIEIALATHAVGTFRISFWKFGPTELRILLAIGTLRLLHVRHGHDRRLAAACCSTSAARWRSSGSCSPSSPRRWSTRGSLYRAEPLPGRGQVMNVTQVGVGVRS